MGEGIDFSDDVLRALEKADSATIEIPNIEDPKHYKAIAHLAASKASIEEIATMLGITTDEVERISAMERIRELTQEIQRKQYARDPMGRIKSLLPSAIEVTANIMLDPAEKSVLRLKAAEDIMDRSMGKAPQVMNIQTSSISSLFDRLDRIEQAHKNKAIEVESQKMDNGVEEAEIVEAVTRSSPYKKWVEENT